MEANKRLVIISSEILDLSAPMREFLSQNDLSYLMIINNTADFPLNFDTSVDKKGQIWFRKEIIEITKAIVPNEQIVKSPFFRQIPETNLELSKEDEFLIGWTNETISIDNFLRALLENFDKNFSVMTTISPEEPIMIKYNENEVPLRYFQLTGFLEKNGTAKADLDELQQLLAKSSGKKKDRPIEIIADFSRNIFDDEAKKEIAEADAIIWLVNDPCTFTILALHKDFTNTIKGAKATTLIYPNISKTLTFRDQFILSLLDIKPTVKGLLEKVEGIIDILALDSENIDDLNVEDLRSKEFKVIVDDLHKGKKSIETILKGMGIELKDIKIKSKKRQDRISFDQLVTKLTVTTPPEKVESTIDTNETEDTDEKVVNKTINITNQQQGDIVTDSTAIDTKTAAKEQQLTVVEQPPDVDKITDDIEKIEDLEALAEQWKIKEEELVKGKKELQKPPIETETTLSIEEEAKSQLTEEIFTKTIQEIIKEEPDDEIINNLSIAISKNSDMAAYAARKLVSALDEHRGKSTYLIKTFIEFTKERPLIFLKVLTDWALTGLQELDFLAFEERAALIINMTNYDKKFVENFVDQLVTNHLTKSLTPKERERLRTFIGMITARNVSLQRRAINSYLTLYEKADQEKEDITFKENVNREIWSCLLKFDATLVGSELIEFPNEFGNKVISEVLNQQFGSFAHIIYDIVTAYQKGDMSRVLTIAGTVTDTILKRNIKISLAEKIKKFGSISLDALAKRVEMNPEELEQLIYEMIEENELKARIELVDKKFVIIYSKEETEESKEKDEPKKENSND